MKMVLIIFSVLVVFGINVTSCTTEAQIEKSGNQQIEDQLTTSPQLQKSNTTNPRTTNTLTTITIQTTPMSVSPTSVVPTPTTIVETNPTNTISTEAIAIPVVGTEFRSIPLEYAKWTVIEFEYDVIHEPGSDYHFPWTLTIRNDTESDLEVHAYLIHWGFHGWVGYVSETSFFLEATETKKISGEDILGEVFYEEMIFLEDVQIEVYIIEG
ncbi:MAG: hypothetical protein JSV74_00015 [Dehalococcoidia bacterium]|nr:MAG: hypothetical protein JSV74_00015 [Dehalococcoidia bacterium]